MNEWDAFNDNICFKVEEGSRVSFRGVVANVVWEFDA